MVGSHRARQGGECCIGSHSLGWECSVGSHRDGENAVWGVMGLVENAALCRGYHRVGGSHRLTVLGVMQCYTEEVIVNANVE